MLSQEDQVKLIQKYQENQDDEALVSLISSNERLIMKLALFFHRQNRNLSLDDLKSHGYEGLILAVRKFNPEKSGIFFSYAKSWIKAKMRQYIISNISNFSIKDTEGRFLFSNFYKIEKTAENSYAYSAFYNALHPTGTVVLDEYDESTEERIASSSYSLENEVEKKEADNKFKQELSSFSETLNALDKTVFHQRLLAEEEEKTALSEIAYKFGCSSQSVAYREKRLIKMLRKQIFNSRDKDLYHSLLE